MLALLSYSTALIIFRPPLTIPGMGDMSITFTLFADEATEERIERYLNHYLGLHKEAKANWNASTKA